MKDKLRKFLEKNTEQIVNNWSKKLLEITKKKSQVSKKHINKMVSSFPYLLKHMKNKEDSKYLQSLQKFSKICLDLDFDGYEVNEPMILLRDVVLDILEKRFSGQELKEMQTIYVAHIDQNMLRIFDYFIKIREKEKIDNLNETLSDLESSKKEILDTLSTKERSNQELLKEKVRIKKEYQILESQLKERTRQLEKANMDWERAHLEITHMLDLKLQFMNQLSHDLRTPLMPILTLLPLIKPSLTDEVALKDLDVALSNAKYLHQLVNDTLTLTKLDQGTAVFDLKPLDMHAIVNQIITINKVIYDKLQIKVTNNMPKKIPQIMGDKLRITEVLENLSSNATRYVKKNGKIKFIAKKTGDYLTIGVRDDGVGMKKNQVDKIFQEFYKIDESRHEHTSGLGLSICKRIIEKHHGRIYAYSQGLGKGTTMYFTLPIVGAKILEQKESPIKVI